MRKCLELESFKVMEMHKNVKKNAVYLQKHLNLSNGLLEVKITVL